MSKNIRKIAFNPELIDALQKLSKTLESLQRFTPDEKALKAFEGLEKYRNIINDISIHAHDSKSDFKYLLEEYEKCKQENAEMKRIVSELATQLRALKEESDLDIA